MPIPSIMTSQGAPQRHRFNRAEGGGISSYKSSTYTLFICRSVQEWCLFYVYIMRLQKQNYLAPEAKIIPFHPAGSCCALSDANRVPLTWDEENGCFIFESREL